MLFIENYRTENPNSFVLISDLTSFIQIGDLVIVDVKPNNYSISIAELKEGKINHETLQSYELFLKTQNENILHNFYKEKGEHGFKQLIRIAKQHLRMSSTSNILKNKKGKDPFNNFDILLPEKEFITDEYNEDVVNLIEKLQQNSWAINVIDDCLYIGVYTDKTPSSIVFLSWMKSINVDYPIFDFMQSIFSPGIQPHCFQMIGEKNIIDLTLFKKNIKMCLNFDVWMEKSKDIGITARWLSTKETCKILNSYKEYKPVIINNRAIEFSQNEKKMLLFDGLLMRIFFELSTPTTILHMIKYLLELI
ncbi:MAG: hypothetical protein KAT05_03635 [Spirochaetes bacterium]|nr:hypothetical protein [Spirochaetota bacterium]